MPGGASAGAPALGLLPLVSGSMSNIAAVMRNCVSLQVHLPQVALSWLPAIHHRRRMCHAGGSAGGPCPPHGRLPAHRARQRQPAKVGSLVCCAFFADSVCLGSCFAAMPVLILGRAIRPLIDHLQLPPLQAGRWAAVPVGRPRS